MPLIFMPFALLITLHLLHFLSLTSKWFPIVDFEGLIFLIFFDKLFVSLNDNIFFFLTSFKNISLENLKLK